MMFWVMVGFACLIFMIKNPKILFGLMAFISFLLLLGKEYAALPVFALACLALWIIWLQEANDDNKNITDKPQRNKTANYFQGYSKYLFILFSFLLCEILMIDYGLAVLASFVVLLVWVIQLHTEKPNDDDKNITDTPKHNNSTIFSIIMSIEFLKIILGLLAIVSFFLFFMEIHVAFFVFAFSCLALYFVWLKKPNDDDKNITDKPKYDKSIIHEKPPELPHNLEEHSPTIAPQSESQASKQRIQEIKEAIAIMKRNAPVEHVEYSVSDYRRAYYSQLSNKERGNRYERYCGYLLAINGWEVEYSGIVLGNKDKGIDLRAFQEGRMKVAQCKFWSGRIRNATVSQFIGDLEREQDENANLQVIGVFFCKEDKFEEGCKERLEKKGISVQVQDYNNEYPCVKCILASKLYYTPYHAEYDTIRFSIQRGDRHCYDEQLAETLGFKKAP